MKSALADTGCRSYLAGMNIISELGLRRSELIPATMTMHTANNSNINIIGAAILGLLRRYHSG